MMPGIIESHNSTQLQLDGFAAAFDACPDPKVEGDSAADPVLIQMQSVSRSSDSDDLRIIRRRRNRRRSRRRRTRRRTTTTTPTTTTTTTTTGVIEGKFARTLACRAREAAASADNQKCQGDLAPLQTAKNSSCNALKQQETKPVPEDFCTPTDPYDQWLISTKGRVKEMKDKLTGLKDGCGNATQLADDKKKECDATQGAFDGNKTDCDQQQADAEAAVCAE